MQVLPTAKVAPQCLIGEAGWKSSVAGRLKALEVSADDLHASHQVIAQRQDTFVDLLLRHQAQQFAVIFLGRLAEPHRLKVETQEALLFIQTVFDQRE